MEENIPKKPFDKKRTKLQPNIGQVSIAHAILYIYKTIESTRLNLVTNDNILKVHCLNNT